MVKYLKFFTWLDRAAIEELERAWSRRRRRARRSGGCAREVTAMVHGADGARRRPNGRRQVLFGGSLAGVSADDLLMVFEDAPADDDDARGVDRVDRGGGDVRTPAWRRRRAKRARLIKQGGVYLNGERVSDERRLMHGERRDRRPGGGAAEGASASAGSCGSTRD